MRSEEKREKDREYYQKNKERINARIREKYQARMQDPELRKEYCGYHKRYRARKFPTDPIRHIKSRAYTSKHRAHKRGIPYDLDTAYLQSIFTGKCALTGIEFDLRYGGQKLFLTSLYSPSLDRIFPELGYVKGNVRWVLNAVNAMRGTGTDEDILAIAKALVGHLEHASPAAAFTQAA